MSGGVLSAPGIGQGLVLAEERLLPAPGPLAPLLPGGGVRRGSVVGVTGSAETTLLLSLLVEPLAQGSWAAVVGVPDLGVEAAAGLGVDLARLALVPRPGSSWPAVLAVLLDSVELVAVRPPGRCRPGDARRLVAQARERGSVLVVAAPPGHWPEAPELMLSAEADGWEGLGAGSGTLKRRRGRVVVSGRRGAGRPLAATCWLPGPDGRFAPRGPRGAPPRVQTTRGEPEVMAWVG